MTNKTENLVQLTQDQLRHVFGGGGASGTGIYGGASGTGVNAAGGGTGVKEGHDGTGIWVG